MAVDERSRHEVYLWLEEAAGPERAATVMEMLPPVGWADVATKHDLVQLGAQLELKIDANCDALRAEWRRDLLEQTRTMLFGMVAMVFTAVSLTYAAVRLG